MSKELLMKFFDCYKNDYALKNQLNQKTEPKSLCHLLDRRASEAQRSLNSPAFVQWEVTTKCNLRCRHCYINSKQIRIENNKGKEKEELNTAECLYVANELGKNNVVFVEIQGGEPFLRDDLFKIIRALKKHGISVGILSNGTLLTPRTIKRLVSVLHPASDSLQISLDGPNEKINDSIRSPGSFSQIMNALELCKDVPFKVVVNTTLNDLNVDYVYDIYQLVSSISANFYYGFFTLHQVGRGKTMKYTKIEEGVKQATKIKESERKKKGCNVVGTVGYIMGIPGYVDAIIEKFGNKKNLVMDRGTPTRSSMDINADGWCYPAAYLQARELRGGNIREKTLKEIWNCSEWNEIRHAVTTLYPTGKGCKDCKIAAYCSQGCLSAKYWHSHKFDVPDPQCLYYQLNQPHE